MKASRYPRRLLSLALFLWALGGGGSLVAQTVSPFTFDSVRSRAMGGIHTALADDLSALFSNPAGFSGIEGELSIAEISLGLYGPLVDLTRAISQTVQGGSMPPLSTLISPAGLFAGADLVGPIAVGWVGENLGFGFFNRIHTDASISGSDIYLKAMFDVLAAGGYTLRFELSERQTLDAGFLLKSFLRYQISERTSVLSLEELFSLDLAGSAPFDAIVGIGLDLGLRYSFSDFLTLGLSCIDVYSPALDISYTSLNDFNAGSAPLSQSYVTIRPRLNAGVMYQLDLPFIRKYASSLNFMANYKDILDLFSPLSRNPILNTSVGMELVLLDALSLRAGIQDALLSLGAGMDLTFMRLDFAIRGLELGLDPGGNPQMGMDLALLFRY